MKIFKNKIPKPPFYKKVKPCDLVRTKKIYPCDLSETYDCTLCEYGAYMNN